MKALLSRADAALDPTTWTAPAFLAFVLAYAAVAALLTLWERRVNRAAAQQPKH